MSRIRREHSRSRPRSAGRWLAALALLALLPAVSRGAPAAEQEPDLRSKIALHIAIAAGMEEEIQLALDREQDERLVEILDQMRAWRRGLKAAGEDLLRRFPERCILVDLTLEKDRVTVRGLAPTPSVVQTTWESYADSPVLAAIEVADQRRVVYQDTFMVHFRLDGRLETPYPAFSSLSKQRASARQKIHHPRPTMLATHQLAERLNVLRHLIRSGLEVTAERGTFRARAEQAAAAVRERLMDYRMKASGRALEEALSRMVHDEGLRILELNTDRRRRWQRLWFLPADLRLEGSPGALLRLLARIETFSPTLIVPLVRANHSTAEESLTELVIDLQVLAAWADPEFLRSSRPAASQPPAEDETAP